jgi:Fe-S cluster assembly iron-binding protein IscA
VGMVLDELDKNEQPITINGIEVLVDDYELTFIGGAVVDYVKESRGEGFVINNSGSAC